MTAFGRKEDAGERKGRQISTKPREAPVISKGWTFRLECYEKHRETPQSELRNTILVKCVKQNNSPTASGKGHNENPASCGGRCGLRADRSLASLLSYLHELLAGAALCETLSRVTAHA